LKWGAALDGATLAEIRYKKSGVVGKWTASVIGTTLNADIPKNTLTKGTYKIQGYVEGVGFQLPGKTVDLVVSPLYG